MRSATFPRKREPALVIKRAVSADLSALVGVLLSSRRAFIPYAPIPHGDDEVQRWMEGLLARENCVTSIARLGKVPVGVLVVAAQGDVNWIDQLYVAPGRTGMGIGGKLLAHAVGLLGRETAIRLFTFQANAGARRFYERAGFKPVAFSDGSGNEERCPDVLYQLEADLCN